MNKTSLPHRAEQAVLIALLLASPLAAWGAAARVDFAAGEVKAVAPDGRSRPLNKGAEIQVGDTVEVGKGQAQVRFTDGAQVALSPQSQFRVDDYRFAGKTDGSEKGFFSLLKGGMRTITGLIGRSNRENYKVSTTIATIGIRGTEYSVAYGNSISVTTGEGSVEVCNAAGCLIVNSGETAFVPDANTRPAMTFKKTELPPVQQVVDKVVEYVAGNDVNDEGQPANLPPTPPGAGDGVYPTGTNLAFMSAEYNPSTGGHNAWNNMGCCMSISVDEQGIRTIEAGYYEEGKVGISEYISGYDRGTAKVFEGGADAGVIGWGRWAGGQAYLWGWGNQTLTDNQGFHFVVGELTMEDTFPKQGSANYSLIGATQPTETRSDAQGGWSVTGGSMMVDFVTSSLSGVLGLNLSRPGEEGTFDMNFNGYAAQFSGITASVSRTSGTVDLCAAAACPGYGTVAFFGAAASHAGLIYEFNAGAYYVQGAAAFKR